MRFSRTLICSLVVSLAVARALPGEVFDPAGEDTGGDEGGTEEGGGAVAAPAPGDVGTGTPSNQGAVDPSNPQQIQARPQDDSGEGSAAQPGSGNQAGNLRPQSAQALAARRPGDSTPDTNPMSMHDAGYKLTSDTPANWDDEEDEWDTDYALSAIEGIKAEVAKGTPDPAVEGIPSTIEAYKTKELMWDHGKNPIIESAADKHGHITIKEMNKDANERPEPNKLPIKELIGQSMIDWAGSMRQVKTVTQANVVNKDTVRDLNRILGPMGTSAQYRKLTPADGDSWSVLANSPNGGALFRYANDHYHGDGGWQPVTLYVYRDAGEFDSGHMVWVYGDPPP